ECYGERASRGGRLGTATLAGLILSGYPVALSRGNGVREDRHCLISFRKRSRKAVAAGHRTMATRMGETVMSAEESHPEDEAILSQLIACDQALAAGIPLRRHTDAETPMEWLTRLQGDLSCIQALRQVLSPRATVKRPALAPESPFPQFGR